jgi:hypothetical protein
MGYQNGDRPVELGKDILITDALLDLTDLKDDVLNDVPFSDIIARIDFIKETLRIALKE